jgi:hypothetical protein
MVMVRIEGGIVIGRPVEDVFDFVADERNEPLYNPRMIRAEKVTPGPVDKGTRWAATIESRGRPLGMVIELTDHTRPTRLGNTTTMPPSTWRSSAPSSAAGTPSPNRPNRSRHPNSSHLPNSTSHRSDRRRGTTRTEIH